MKRAVMVRIVMVSLVAGQVPAAYAAQGTRIKYAKTEVEKARGKCVGAVLGGALLGAVIGSIASKHGAGTGAALGVAAGAGACVVLMANAKRADRIIAAQLASMKADTETYETSWAADDGQTTMTYTGTRGEMQTIDGAYLQPVLYESNGEKFASPVLAAGPQDCRYANGEVRNGSDSTALTQLTCRSPDGDYYAYSLRKKPATA